MRRWIIAICVVTLTLAAVTQASARWMATQTMALHLEKQGVHITEPIFMTFRPYEVSRLGLGTRPAGYVLSYADVETFQIAARHIPAGTTVMLDFESWDFTPKTERHNALYWMTRFVQIAHRRGLIAGLCPSRMFLTGMGLHPGAEKIPADFFVAQLYLPAGPALRTEIALIRHARTGPVYMKIVVGPQFSLDYITRQYRTTRRSTPDFVLWGGRDTASGIEAAAFLSHFGSP